MSMFMYISIYTYVYITLQAYILLFINKSPSNFSYFHKNILLHIQICTFKVHMMSDCVYCFYLLHKCHVINQIFIFKSMIYIISLLFPPKSLSTKCTLLKESSSNRKLTTNGKTFIVLSPTFEMQYFYSDKYKKWHKFFLYSICLWFWSLTFECCRIFHNFFSEKIFMIRFSFKV